MTSRPSAGAGQPARLLAARMQRPDCYTLTPDPRPQRTHGQKPHGLESEKQLTGVLLNDLPDWVPCPILVAGTLAMTPVALALVIRFSPTWRNAMVAGGLRDREGGV